MATADKVLNPGGLAWAMAHAPAGSDTASVVDGFRAAGYAINIPGYRPQDQGQPAAPIGGAGPPGLQGYGQDALAALTAGGTAAAGYGAVAGAQRIGRSRTVGALAAHTGEEALADKGPIGYLARLGKKVGAARAVPRTSPNLELLGPSIQQVPERTLPPIEPMRPPIQGNFGGQPPAGPPGLSLVPPPEPVPTRPITVAGAPARAPAQTTEPPYTGGRGASGPVLARRTEAQAKVAAGESVTGGRKVPLGKAGHVIGEVGDEARVAGRNASSLEDLLRRSIEIAKNVAPEARAAVFKTAKAASKFAHEADSALGGPAMIFFDLLPASVIDEAVNTTYTTDPRTGKIVKRKIVTTGA